MTYVLAQYVDLASLGIGAAVLVAVDLCLTLGFGVLLLAKGRRLAAAMRRRHNPAPKFEVTDMAKSLLAGNLGFDAGKTVRHHSTRS